MSKFKVGDVVVNKRKARFIVTSFTNWKRNPAHTYDIPNDVPKAVLLNSIDSLESTDIQGHEDHFELDLTYILKQEFQADLEEIINE